MEIEDDELYFDEYGEIDTTRRNLPHWQQDGKLYFVTWRLADSLPQEALAQLDADRAAWVRHHGNALVRHLSPELREEWYNLFHRRVQRWLDAGYGSCVLKRPEPKRIMFDALKFFDGQRYRLGSFAIAGNHVHVLVAPLTGIDLSDILHSWKSFTGNAINKAVGRQGRMWMDENFDRLVRDRVHLERVEAYVARHERQGAYVELRDVFST
ncbi:MAG: transposase [Flavobacteriales bacterium]|nr:transposase [Flavobacteriales bacterium]